MEAFRKQKATAKSLQSAPKADTELRESPRVASQPSPSAKPVSSDTSLARAASVLPVSTSAQPISTGGSEQDVDVTRLHLSAAFAGSSQAAKSDAPVQQAASPSASLVRIPFTGITAGNRSSRQTPTPQAAASATISAPSAYRSRLPPPPPVFKALTSRPQSSLLQNSNRTTGLSVNPSPWSPAVLKGVSPQGANTLSKGQPAGSVPAFLRPPISQFHPAKPGFAQNNARSQHQEQTSSSSREAAGRSSSVDLSNGSVSPPVVSPSAAAHSGTAEEAVPEAATSSGSQTASQLSLLDERQLIPGVSTGRTEEGFTNTEAFEAVVKEREASLDDAPAKPEVDDLEFPCMLCHSCDIIQLLCHTCSAVTAIPVGFAIAIDAQQFLYACQG